MKDIKAYQSATSRNKKETNPTHLNMTLFKAQSEPEHFRVSGTSLHSLEKIRFLTYKSLTPYGLQH